MRLASEGTKIDLLNVLVGHPSPTGMSYPAARELVEALSKQERTWAEKQLAQLIAFLPEEQRGECILREGSAADVVCDVAAEGDYSLIAVSTHGRTGLKHMLIGSVAERIVRFASVPVVVVR